MSQHSSPEAELLTADTWQAILDESVDPMFEPAIRRKVYRHAVYVPLMLRYQSEGRPRKVTLNLANVSSYGVMAKATAEIDMETRVELEVPVEHRQFLVRGTVVHCTGTLGGFKVGIQLDFPEELSAEVSGPLTRT